MTPRLENSLDDETMKTEKETAIWMANKALDIPNADPDDDLRTVSRQFLRSIEKLEEYKQALRELINIAGFYHDQTITYSEMPYKNWSAIIDKARKLLDSEQKTTDKGDRN